MNRIFQDPAPTPSAPSQAASVPSPRLAIALGRVMDIALHGSLVLAVLWFSSFTMDALELPKQTALIMLACVGLVAWLGKSLAEKRFALAHNWLHLIVVLFAAGILLASLVSSDRYVSLVGTLGQMPWAFATIASLTILYFIAVNRIRSATQAYNLLLSFFAVSFVAAVIGLAQLAGWYWFGATLSHNAAFTTIGSAYSLALFLTAPLVAAAALALHGCRDRVCVLGAGNMQGNAARVLVWVTAGASLLYLLFIDLKAAWAVLFLANALLLGLSAWRTNLFGRPVRLALPGLLLLISALLFFLSTPFKTSLPSEVSPSHLASWEIAKQTLQAHPLFGSGPGTWAFDYAQYRVQAINMSPFWNVRFDRGYSSFLTLLATTGIVGTALWLLLGLSVIVRTALHLSRERNDDHWFAYATLFCAWAALWFGSFAYNFNVAHQAAFWILLAALGSFVSTSWYAWDAKKNSGLFAGLTALFALLIIGGLSAMWLAGQRLVADHAFQKAVQDHQSGAILEQTVRDMESTVSLNAYPDVYQRNLSQAYLMQIQQTIAAGRPDQAAVQQLIAQAGKASEAALAAASSSPANVDNWANLGNVYVNVMSVASGADEHAIASYIEASKREPLNPLFLTEIGRIYYLRADAYQVALNDKDAKKRTEAQAQIKANLTSALEWLKKAITAKPDYFPAHYHLGVVYERQGRVREAIGELEQALSANKQDAGLAFELAVLYERNGERSRAQDLLEQIVKVQPDNANAHWYLASVYEGQGKTAAAKEQLEALLRLLPGNVAVQQHLQALTQTPPTSVRALPEPIPENISGQTDQNPLQKP